MSHYIDGIFEIFMGIIPEVRLCVLMVSIIPLVETRLAIPFALRSGLPPFEAWLYSFLGSSLIVPILLLLLIPLINLIAKLPLLNKMSDYVLESFSKKAQAIEGGKKAYIGLLIFSALPLPLTGVYTSSAVAAILKLKFKLSLIAIVAGNLISSVILTLLCYYLEGYIDLIITIITIIAVIGVLLIIIKSIMRNKEKTKIQGNAE